MSILSDDYDVVVIGTGAGGACAAYSMALAGMKVLCLEKGPWLDLPDFFEGGYFGKKFSSFGRGDELLYKEKEILMPPTRERDAWKNEVRFLSYAGGDLKPTTSGWQSQMVGGGTVHYGGASFRAKPVDFEMKSRFGGRQDTNAGLNDDQKADLRDWPIRFSELEPWYEKAEKIIGIAGAPGSGLPPLRFSKAGKILEKTLAEHPELEAELIPTPMAINSRNHEGRSPCHHSGLCQDFACRFEAKSDMRVTTLRRALETGNLQIIPNAFVKRIHHTGDAVAQLECIIGRDTPQTVMVRCPKLVVACESIESVRLLLASGVGNSAVLGRYFMVHVTGGARSIAREVTSTWDTAPHTSYIDSYYERSQEGAGGFLKTGILLVSSASGPVYETNSKQRWGEGLKLFFNRVYPFKMDLSYIGDGLATKQNRIQLSSKTDRFGMPGTEVHYTPHPFDMNAAEWIRKRTLKILQEAGAETEETNGLPPELKAMLAKAPTMHQLYHASGGARAGDDPAENVLDRNGRVHGFSNVFVTDSSYFPAGLGVNPTLTIQANALRIGSFIASAANPEVA